MKRRMICGFAALVMVCGLSTGCAGLSLFSSTHTHYDTSEATEQKLEELAPRVRELKSSMDRMNATLSRIEAQTKPVQKRQ